MEVGIARASGGTVSITSPTATRAATVEGPRPSYNIQGREVRLPADVRDATAAFAFYLVSARAAQTLIDASGLRIAQIVPGRTVCTIGTINYKDGAWAATTRSR